MSAIQQVTVKWTDEHRSSGTVWMGDARIGELTGSRFSAAGGYKTFHHAFYLQGQLVQGTPEDLEFRSAVALVIYEVLVGIPIQIVETVQ